MGNILRAVFLPKLVDRSFHSITITCAMSQHFLKTTEFLNKKQICEFVTVRTDAKQKGLCGFFKGQLREAQPHNQTHQNFFLVIFNFNLQFIFEMHRHSSLLNVYQPECPRPGLSATKREFVYRQRGMWFWADVFCRGRAAKALMWTGSRQLHRNTHFNHKSCLILGW